MMTGRSRLAGSASAATAAGQPGAVAIYRAFVSARSAWQRRGTLAWAMLVWAVALIVLAANQHGQVFFDTKLGVDLDPAGFYARLWHLWNPLEWFGSLQDQYIGYAFPMGPFYLAAHLLGVPVWLTERLWLSLLVAVAFAGIVKLAQALGIGTSRSRAVAGLAFALWPTFTIVIGSTSAGILPGVLAPWAVLPLVKAAKGGPAWRAAARSGAAVLCMGGVNATSTLDVLILPALFIVAIVRGRRRIELAAWWAGAVLLANSWWAVPLLLQARYSFNFLPYVEQSATTTQTMSAAAFLRGSGNWTAYLDLGQPWLRAGWVMVAFPFAIVAAAIASATGLLGLARRDLPAGGWLRLSLGTVALMALAGYSGPLGGTFHQQVDQLLNGVLAPVRSVYKVEPVAAAVLALGIAHALVLRARSAGRRATDPAYRTVWHLLATPVIGLVLLGLAYPQVSGQVLNAGSFKAVPRYWYQVAAFLRQHSPQAPALVVPGAAHGTFLWGEPVDDPLEPLATSPWVAQGLVPYGGAGSQLLLSSLEAALTSGERAGGLVDTLARSGIRYVVVRNDLSPQAIGYTMPQVVHQTLTSSGFRRVAAFGPLITGAQTDPGDPQVQYALPSYPAVEVFTARTATGLGPPSPAVALPISRTVLVNGGPDALLQLAGQRLLDPSAPAVVAGDRLVTRPAFWAVTDTLRRADHAFGIVGSAASYTYAPAETNPVDDPLGGAGGPPRQMLPVSAPGHQTVAVITGALTVTASSAGSWLAETPQIDPVNAFDANLSTVWAESDPVTAVGQWIQVTFRHPVVLPGAITVAMLDDLPIRPVPDRLTVTTATGTVTSAVRRTAAAQLVRVSPGPTRTVRITIAGVRGGVAGGPGAGFTDVTIPGVTVARFLQPPQSPSGRPAPAVAFSFQQQVPSPASLANVASYPSMARTFVTYSRSKFRMAALAMAVPGPGLDSVLSALTPARKDTLEVTASSTWGSLPSLAPANLFRTDHPGSWIAGGPKPVIRLSWPGLRTIRQLVIQPLPGFAAAPESVKITSPDGVRFASVGLDGFTEIVPPLTTRQMTISFPVVQFATPPQGASGSPAQLPVGIGRLSIPALAGLRVATLAPLARFALPCGSGPEVLLDGRALDTAVAGTAGDLTLFRPVQVRLCGPGSLLTLFPGRHRLEAARPGAFTITDLSLLAVPSGTSPAAPKARTGGQQAGSQGSRQAGTRQAGTGQAGTGQAGTGQAGTGQAGTGQAGGLPRSVKILHWQPEYRQIRIGPGAASYLELHQNANPGWTATLDGRTLTPVRLDGWQQAFAVPGVGGVITLTFRPVWFYHFWIISSAIGVLALLGVALTSRKRRRVREPMDGALPAGGMLAVAAPSGPVSPGPAAGGWVGAGVGLLALCGLLYVVGGPMALVVPVVAACAYVWPGWHGWVAFAAMAVTGVLAAISAHPAETGSGAFGAPAQACALVALAVTLTPVLPRRSQDAPFLADDPVPARTRFAVPDELTCYYDRPDEPANVHIEVRVPGGLDEAAVRASVHAVLAAEPRVRARRARAGTWRRSFYWEFPAAPDADPVLITSYADETDLAGQRAAFLSQSPSLDVSPPLLFLLASGPGGDHLILNAHHACYDGLSCLRLLRLVAQGCGPGAGPAAAHVAAGVRREPLAAGLATAAATAAPAAPAAVATAATPAASPAGRGRRARSGAITRIAGHPASRDGSHPGYGAQLLRWDRLPAPGWLQSAGCSVNDLLITALMIAITEWNAARGGRIGSIRITMPVGDRAQAGSGGQWANRSVLATISARVPVGANPADLLRDVARQSAHAKDHPGPQVDLLSRGLAMAPVPVAVKDVVLRAALRYVGPLYCDTSLLSNLGVIESLDFGGQSATDVWFSTSAHMPRGLSVGAVTAGGRLRLTFRYRRALFSDAAAAVFAARYVQILDALAQQEIA